MADVKGVNYTNYDSTPRAMVESAQWGGRMRVMYDTYTATSALGTGSTIKVGRLPKNATFHAGYVITSKSLGSAKYKIEIGSTEVVAARTHTNALFDPQWFGKNSGTVTSAESDITVTTSAASTPGDEVWQVAILYTVD